MRPLFWRWIRAHTPAGRQQPARFTPLGDSNVTANKPLPSSIADLTKLVNALTPAQREPVERIFQIAVTQGKIVPPDALKPWIEKTFGSLNDALQQDIVRVMNRWTFEGATFNPLRARRPGSGATQQMSAVPAEVVSRIEEMRNKDDFCDPYQRTPADTFGRVFGDRVVTGSNIAKFDGWHGLLIFKEHDPLAIDAALVQDALKVAYQWAQRAHDADPEARHFFLGWNCLWRAGASQVHGHAHITLSQTMAHANVEFLRAVSERYKRETRADYFADLIAAHAALGLVVSNGPVIRFASLTPVKESEVILLVPPSAAAPDASWGERLGMLAEPLAETLRIAREQLGTLAFNVAIFGPPLDAPQQGWQDFPFIARFVDRGDPLSSISDIAALELFGSSVISSDPFAVASALRRGAS